MVVRMFLEEWIRRAFLYIFLAGLDVFRLAGFAEVHFDQLGWPIVVRLVGFECLDDAAHVDCSVVPDESRRMAVDLSVDVGRNAVDVENLGVHLFRLAYRITFRSAEYRVEETDEQVLKSAFVSVSKLTVDVFDRLLHELIRLESLTVGKDGRDLEVDDSIAECLAEVDCLEVVCKCLQFAVV